jgi:hypothetical protein
LAAGDGGIGAGGSPAPPKVIKYPHIDYDQRPAGYWEPQDVLAALLRNVKGTERRAMITAWWASGQVGALDDELRADSLSEPLRASLGSVHPALMGGEYLPDFDEFEVEIARMDLESVTADAISIRARPGPRGIHYAIVDEYGSGFELSREWSAEPLTLWELIAFLDGSGHPDEAPGLAIFYNDMNAESGSRASLRSFTRITSTFYDQLEEHYEHVFDDWVAENPGEVAVDEDEADDDTDA